MPTILIIDDEPLIIENLSFILELDNYDILSANNGIEGINVFQKNIDKIDVVLSDMRMPGLSGMEVLNEIKTIKNDVSVIILTGHGVTDNAVSAMKAGAFDYLNKPVNADKLLISIENAINNKKLLDINKKLQEDIINKNNYLQGLHDSAQKILLNLIPKELPTIEHMDFKYIFEPCDEVGGDLFDIFKLNQYVCFYVFDVTNHGILASVVALILKFFFEHIKIHANNNIADKDMLHYIYQLNSELIQYTSNNIFATLFFGFYNVDNRKFNYISAGHPDQIVITNNKITTLPSTGTMLGLFDTADYKIESVDISLGDKIILYTDGIPEAQCNNEIFGLDRLLKSLDVESNIHDNLSNIIKEVKDYSCDNTDDDITILGIEFTKS